MNMGIAEVRDRVRLWECGIGRVEGEGYLRSHALNRIDSSHLEYKRAEPGSENGSVISRTMASAIETLSGSVLVKMDIEGSEDEILAVRKDWIERVDCMMVEFHEDTNERMWVSILRAEGWKCLKYF